MFIINILVYIRATEHRASLSMKRLGPLFRADWKFHMHH